MQSAMLTTNAKASGRKLTLIELKDLDDRQRWMADVVLKAGLLGSHDTIRTVWVPQNQDYQVKITGMASVKSQPFVKLEGASSDTSTASEVGGMNDTSTAGVSSEVKREKGVTTQDVVTRSTQYILTPGKAVVKTDLAETGEADTSGDESNQDNDQLAESL